MGELSIASIKQQLQEELGPENFLLYLGLLREWFAQRLTKHMFDFEVETYFKEECYKLHNLLLRSILLQCLSGGEAHSSQSVTSNNAQSTESQQQDESIYIIPTIPGEEPFIYPANAKEYPQAAETQHAVDLMEQDPPPDCDWLHPVEVTYPAEENIMSTPQLKNRFPPWFAHDYQRVNTKDYTHEINVVRNVTHLPNVKDIVERKPQLKQHFVIPAETDKNAPYLTSGSSLYGKILIKAWDHNIQHVNTQVTEHAVNAVRDHMKNILLGIIKQRRPFRMRDKRILHSIGVPYPNPYLRQGFHMYDEPYTTDTTKMADVVMQVPSPFPTIDEKERLAALQVASNYPSKDSPYISSKGTMLDFLCAIQENPSLIPHNSSRLKITDTLLRNCKGFQGTHNVQYSECFEEDDEFSHSPLLPLSSY